MIRYYMAWLTVGLVWVFYSSQCHATDKSDWFRSLMRPDTGTSCCNVSDCHKTVADWRGNQWWAKVEEQWTPIPNEKVVKDHDSFDGEAYVCSGTARFIFCFVPPGFGS